MSTKNKTIFRTVGLVSVSLILMLVICFSIVKQKIYVVSLRADGVSLSINTVYTTGWLNEGDLPKIYNTVDAKFLGWSYADSDENANADELFLSYPIKISHDTELKAEFFYWVWEEAQTPINNDNQVDLI